MLKILRNKTEDSYVIKELDLFLFYENDNFTLSNVSALPEAYGLLSSDKTSVL